jgi:hypothetical protein
MRTLPALILSAATIVTAAPRVAIASEQHATTTASVSMRVYDPYRHDRHTWNRVEENAYRAYLAERHRAYIAYRHQRVAERRAYWRWRHAREERLEHERR